MALDLNKLRIGDRIRNDRGHELTVREIIEEVDRDRIGAGGRLISAEYEHGRGVTFDAATADHYRKV